MNTPYVHLYNDALEDLPLLAKGSNAVTLLTIGKLLPQNPEGVNALQIINATALSARTIQAALTLLISNGLVLETSDGKFTPVKHIEYRKYTNNVRTPIESSINQSNQSVKSNQSLVRNTEKEFASAYSAFAAMCGGVVSPSVAEQFGELWDEFPDVELHQRAVRITLANAERPNLKYYEAVIRTGAVERAPKKDEPKSVEVRL